MSDKLKLVIKHYPEVTGVHPACTAVPGISDDDMEALSDSIKKDGLGHDILLTKDGLLIDGRNRLIACYEGQVEPRFKKISTDPWLVAYTENIARRHLQTGQKAAFAATRLKYEREEAKRRQVRKPESVVETLPQQNENGKSRDKAAEPFGISGKSVEKFEKIESISKDIADEVRQGFSTLEEGFRKAKQKEREMNQQPVDHAPTKPSVETTTIITAAGIKSEIALPKNVVFNSTTNAVDWAAWTWNPVTGCEHGCKFCYAREIANSDRMAPYYPNKFEPTFHEYRLEAPKHTRRPKSNDPRDGRVFVCSMADLFGKWVPNDWIESVFDACIESPEWEYLFLTKWPARYSKMPLIERAWYGASVIQQSDVKRVETAMSDFEVGNAVRWISLEPMLEPIQFNDLSWCDLVVIGSQTSTVQPDGPVPSFAPEFDWIVDVVNQCRDVDVPYYLKANLGLENPGMKLPKSLPRRNAGALVSNV